VFEVDPSQPESRLSRTPIRAMGRFSHEAAGVDRATGIVYLTEDDFFGSAEADPRRDTLYSFLYRFLPNDRRPRPGALLAGGRLQVLTADEAPADADLAGPRQRFVTRWLDVEADDPNAAGRKLHALRFNRLEGAHFAGGAFWFADTLGGEERLGQIFRYSPAQASLELFYEGTKGSQMESPDNVGVTPWGDLWFAEDETETSKGDARNRVMGITPEGAVYPFAINRLGSAEVAGPAFSPDGKTWFLNIQSAGLTLAIWGPFPKPSRTRRTRLSRAAPPPGLGPRLSGDLIETARRWSTSPLEVAALDRLGVPLA
jgi:secreted PhoX family phosphatase